MLRYDIPLTFATHERRYKLPILSWNGMGKKLFSNGHLTETKHSLYVAGEARLCYVH